MTLFDPGFTLGELITAHPGAIPVLNRVKIGVWVLAGDQYKVTQVAFRRHVEATICRPWVQALRQQDGRDPHITRCGLGPSVHHDNTKAQGGDITSADM